MGVGDDKDKGFEYLTVPGARWNTVPWMSWAPAGDRIAYFVRTEMRFSTWPYRLQHLLSPNLSVAKKRITIQAFLQADGCCLGPFGRRYRLEFQGIHNNPCPTCVY